MKYIWLDGAWEPAATVPSPAAGTVAIHRDLAEPLLCHADGRMHGSRSTYDAAVRAAGCEIVGRSEARRLQEAGAWRGISGMGPVSATLRRILNEQGE